MIEFKTCSRIFLTARILVRLMFASPTFCYDRWTSCDTQPNFGLLRKIAMVPLSDLNRILRLFGANLQPCFVLCLTHSGGCHQPHNGFVHLPLKKLKYLKHGSGIGIPNELVSFVTFPFTCNFAVLTLLAL